MRFARQRKPPIQMKGIMRNGSMWIIVIPTPRNHSPEEIADAYGDAGVEMAKLMAEGNGYGGGLDLGPAKVLRRDSIGGLPATVVERRGTETLTDMPIRVPVHRGRRQKVHVSDPAAGRRQRLRRGVPASRRRCSTASRILDGDAA